EIGAFWPGRAGKAGSCRCRGRHSGSLRRNTRRGRPVALESQPGETESARPLVPARGARRRPHRALRRAGGQFHRGGPELRRSRGRNRRADPARTHPVQQGPVLHRRPERRRDHPARLHQARLGVRDRDRHRRARLVRGRERGAELRRRLLPVPRRVGARVPDRARRAVDEGQELPHLRAARPLARHPRRGRRRAKSRHVARRQRPAPPDRLDQDHDFRLRPDRLLHLALHDPGAGRRHHHRHAAGGRARDEAAAVPEGGRCGDARDREARRAAPDHRALHRRDRHQRGRTGV
ncbi:MAG: Fumarylacetoacetate hydrolase family protein, partial [uncultured Microvirga sp.]